MATSCTSALSVAAPRSAALRSAAVTAKRAPLLRASRVASAFSAASSSRRAVTQMAVELDFESKIFEKELITLDDEQEVGGGPQSLGAPALSTVRSTAG